VSRGSARASERPVGEQLPAPVATAAVDATGAPRRPRIVALLPAHNEADVVRASIEALLAQERPLDRIVVVSDNSTDATFAIASTYPGVTAIETVGNAHRKSGALTAAWLRFATDADLVVSLDADTVLPPDAVGAWEQEFLADPTLGASASKFLTVKTGSLWTRLQRFEFAMWAEYGLQRKSVPVVSGTGCMYRNRALLDVATRDDREGPWSYDSAVEDYELTYRIKRAGYRCRTSPTVRAYTDAMPTLRALWGQRHKWQAGTVEDMLRIGVDRYTFRCWLRQLGGAAAVLLRVLSPVVLILGIFLGAVHFNPVWLLIPVISILVDVKRVRHMPFRDRRDLLLAVSFVPNEIMNTLRCIWFVQAWSIVLRTRLTGRQRDLWGSQYAAEGRG
jgi:cellulose synthase/poly-beta-1,6-N-acetylglucosamine synthase-like glycosyltransferase